MSYDFLPYAFLIAGLLLLVFAGDALVRGSVAMAVRFNVPHLIIGLTIVAFGTSAPELLVSLRSAFQGVPGLAVGNVVGSNIANIWLVLGVPALIAAICCDQKYITHNLVFMLVVSAALIVLSFWQPLTFWHGAILFSLLLVFLADCIYRAKTHKNDAEVIDEDIEELIEEAKDQPSGTPWKMLGLLGGGFIGLAIGAELTVSGAIDVAKAFGISEATIGLTVVAIGTSLPELAATVMAAFRNQPGIALGNAIGSNIYNIGAVLGITAMITPLEVAPQFLEFDMWVMLAVALSILPFVLMKAKITRLVGLVFILAYGAYIYMVIDNGRLPMEQSSLSLEMKRLAVEVKPAAFEVKAVAFEVKSVALEMKSL